MQWLSLVLALQQAPAVQVPRIEAPARVDGVMDEEAWSRAARLTGFFQYEPMDGRPAAEQTEVRVWYAPDAIWFGIIAHDSQPQSIRATRADRDNIGDNDHVIIHLDTFRDRRRAFFFAVNPTGIQADGVRTEGAATAGRAFGGNVDHSPDFFYESRGRITESGYVVEVRIPFKSLRYPSSSGAMEWGINIERRTQRTGFADTWPDVRRGSASYLGQGGVIGGLHDLERGVVVEAQPFFTISAPGSRIGSGAFERDEVYDVGGSVRLGFTNISLDATINPDFSQVEADEGQVTVNQRFALFVPEKRPFFLEGIELFATPNQLVYTRQIADPIFGGKVTGKVGALSVAYMSALDEDVDQFGNDALFNIARVRRDIGTSSAVGVTLTDRSMRGSDGYNRVAASDTRIVFGGMYYFEGQFGASWTQAGDVAYNAPIWKLELDRTGRSVGFNWSVNGVGQNFEAQAGFVNRQDIINANAFNRFTYYGAAGAVLERITTFFGAGRLFSHSAPGDGPYEGNEFISPTFRFRGGWEVSGRLGRDYVELDPEDYVRYGVQTSAGPRAFTPLDGVSGPGVELSAQTPVFQRFDARASAGTGRVAIFTEGGEGTARTVSGAVSLRPTTSIRAGISATYERIMRTDDSEFARTVIPRVRVEYQPTRAFFVRAIGEYRAERRAALRDPRTGSPITIDRELTTPFAGNNARIDLLASYRPTPGTVAFLGYGAALNDRDAFAFERFERQSDGFFLKLAYLFRR